MEKVSSEQNKINEFILWYNEEAVNYSTAEIGQFFPAIDMSVLINKLAVWYEFKYNNDLIDARENPNIQIFSNEQLMNSLPWYEKIFLVKTRYINMVKIIQDGGVKNVYLSEDGYIVDSMENHNLSSEFKGMHIKDMRDYVLSEGLDVTMVGIDKAIKNYEVQEEIKRKLWESVILTLIMRDKEHGLKRAFYLVKEFLLDSTIVFEYATKRNDRYLLERISEYIEEYQSRMGKKYEK